MRITRLDIEGYRSLCSVTWVPGDLNVIVGANGSGKSNLAEAVIHLSKAAHGPDDFAETMAQAGGILSVAWNATAESLRWLLQCVKKPPKPSRTEKELAASIPPPAWSGSFVYTLDVARVKDTGLWEIAHEGITYRNEVEVEFLSRQSATVRCPSADKVTRSFTVPTDIPALAALLGALSGDDPVHCSASSMRMWSRHYDIRTDQGAAIREPSPITPDARLSADCQNLTDALYNLYRHEPFRRDFDRFMAAAFDGYRGLDFAPTSDGRLSLVIKSKLLRGMTLRELSAGALRYMCLVTLLATPDPPSVLWIEDPEAGLHPGLLPMIAELAGMASARCQVVLCTHSAELLNYLGHFQPTVTVAKLESGKTRLANVDTAELKRRLEKFGLGDLFRSGDLESLAWRYSA